MATFLRDPRVLDADVIVAQEPWKNPFQDTTHHPAKRTHHLIYPPSEEGAPTKVCLFIHKDIDQSRWTHQAHNGNLQTWCLQYTRGDQDRILYIHNIYINERRVAQTILHQLDTVIQDIETTEKNPHRDHLVLGDFNLHHPAWGGPGIAPHAETSHLLQFLDKTGLLQLTDPGVTTWSAQGNKATIDLTFASPALYERTIECKVQEEIDHSSDHYPIKTRLHITAPGGEPPKRRDWPRLDKDKLTTFIQSNLRHPHKGIHTTSSIEHHTDYLVEVIQQAIAASTPWAKPSLYSKPSYNAECRSLVKECKRKRRRHRATQHPEDWEAYQEAKNYKRHRIPKILRDDHRKRVATAAENPKGLWAIQKWTRTRELAFIQGATPELNTPEGTARTPEQKAEALRTVFFPTPPPADLTDIQGFQYPEPIATQLITSEEVNQAIRSTPGDKAPGEDQIPNHVLHKALPWIKEYLTVLFNACLKLGHNPEHFQQSVTVVLRKEGPGRDYTIPKSYRPIALLNTLGKALESIIARRLSYLMEEHHLLPRTHYGGRRGISTDHAILKLVERIRHAWGQGRHVVSLLLLDVAGAYDNVSHKRLIHNLKKRGLQGYTPWIASFLANRRTRLRMPEHTSPSFNTSTGIPQGSPISSILYLLFNADLIDNCTNPREKTYAHGWVDDASILAEGYTEEETTRKLQTIHERAQEWATQHASVFAPNKYQLIHFVNPREPSIQPQHTPLILPGHTIEPGETGKYLGVILDPKLDFEAHREFTAIKANKSLVALKGITASTWGISLTDMRKVYQAVVMPQILYGAAAWYVPSQMTKGTWKKAIHALSDIQKRAAIIISGAFHLTAKEALNIELNLMPLQHRFALHMQETAIRIRTGPRIGIGETTRTLAERKRSGKTPLEEQHDTQLKDQRPELGYHQDWETRTPYIQPPWWTPPTVEIAEDKEKAIEQHDQKIGDPKSLSIYTDGSGYFAKVGAAAVIPETGQQKLQFMGSESISTVYAAELQGVLMALQLIEERAPDDRPPRIKIYTDNQSALRAIRNPQRSSGQYIIRDIIRLLGELHGSDTHVSFHWIPAHQGVKGNEMADDAAKRASRQGLQSTAGIKHLAAPAKMRARKIATFNWTVDWARQRNGQATKRLLPKPTNKAPRLYRNLTKAASSALIQLRTGKIGLNHYLHSINLRDSDQCQCGWGSQTAKHILMDCPKFMNARDRMWRKIRVKTPDIGTDYASLVSNDHAAPAVANFMISTRLLGQFRAIVTDTHPNGEAERGGTIEGRR